jgi:mannose-6-phosphate isomerase-like protein (cupin superfamily)
MVEIREGEHITSEGELRVTLLADIEELGLVEVRTSPGGVAPPLHAHAKHAECFVVLEGELTFRLEDRELVAGPETWVFVPPEVLHTFAVTGDAPARFLDLHAPSSGLGDFVRGLHSARNEDELRAVRAAFDQHPVPEYSSADPGLVVVRRAGGKEGETITDPPNRRAVLLLDLDGLAVTECSYGSGERGAELHVHRHHADAFLVVEGELEIKLREGSLTVPAGTFVLVPPGVVHGFDNESGTTMRYFNLHAPSVGFGDYLRGQNPDFDQHDPPIDGGVDPRAIVAVRLAG